MNEAIEIQLNISDRLENPTLGAVMWSATVHQLECPEKSFISSYDKLLGKSQHIDANLFSLH